LTVELSIAHSKELYGLRYARYRGVQKVKGIKKTTQTSIFYKEAMDSFRYLHLHKLV
jgi:hypothetical protein